jgi:hypothetical protein
MLKIKYRSKSQGLFSKKKLHVFPILAKNKNIYLILLLLSGFRLFSLYLFLIKVKINVN